MQLTRDHIITELYNSKDIAEAIGRMQPAELRDDLRQEMFAELCRKDEADLIAMYQRGEIRFYLARVMLNMATSGRSTFYNQYRKFAEEIVKPGTDLPAGIDEAAIAPSWADHVTEAVNGLDPYERDLFRLYVDMGNNSRLVAEATGISERGVRFAIDRARRKLKAKIRSHD